MNRTFGVGLGLTIIGFLGYLVGIMIAYPGRAFSVTVVIVGITLGAMGRSLAKDRSGTDA